MPPSATRHVAARLRVLAALFCLSGASALVYQVLWLRLLGLVFGVTVYAASTVWAAFMAGLALGSLFGGRLADRAGRPLVWLALAEALVAVTALATPLALDSLHRLYGVLVPWADRSLATLTLVRLVLSSLVLVVPASLMGATLPLALKAACLDGSRAGTAAAVLYASNTGGAIAGTLAAGLLLIPRFGISRSFLAAALANIVVAVGVLLVGRRSCAPEERPHQAHTNPEPGPVATVTGTRRAVALLVLAVFAVSGFVSLALEVVWFRVLTLFLRPTVYGYALMLASVLGGIAIGSALASMALRRRAGRDWTLALGWLEGLVATAAVLSFAVLPAVPAMVDAVGPAVGALIGPYLAYQAIVSAAVILPAMVLFGLAYPIGLHLWIAAGRDEDLGRLAGRFNAANVAGAIAGSLGAGFVLLPWLGSLQTVHVISALTVMSALALLGVSPAPGRTRVVAAGVLSGLWAVAVWGTPDPFAAFLAQRYPRQAVVWQREAVQATVSVHEEQPGHYTLNVSGNHQASTSGSMPWVHQRIGNLPMAVHPEARTALVVGLGGGATAGAVAQHTGVTVDVVELSREVAEAARLYFGPVNYGALDQPNVRVRVDDGRNFLLLNRQRFDVITADVILPIHAGSGNLYSREYFTLARQALGPGGLAMQWVAGTDEEYRLIARTFLSVFPETTVWSDGSLLLGSVNPLELRREDFTWKLATPGRREMLASLGVARFEDLLALYKAGPQELRQFVGEGPILTDDRPMVEYFLSLPRDRVLDLSGLRGDVRRHVRDDRISGGG